MEPIEQPSNKLTLPIAIIVAGALIACAIFLTNKNQAPVSQTQEGNVTAGDITLRPVDSTDHILGSPNAPIMFIEYSDTECPFCKRYHETMHQVVDTYSKDGSVAWVYRNFPIVQLHSKAPKEAEALECAAELGGNEAFWKYTDRIYSITPTNDGLDPGELPKIAEFAGLNVEAFKICLSSGKHTAKIQKDVDEAVKAGARGTPYSIILLKTKAPSTIKPFLESASIQLGLPPGTLGITKDEKKIIVSGNMPFELLQQLIDLLKN
ncbi:MAG: hypothetical protein RJA61_565 [Candidatus Parcubacteria bacterium]|jgi:protein-disulfide isomerase